MVQPGRYRHYKGHEYEVLGVARHSETEEEYVVYRALYGDRGLWIRPKAMSEELVVIEGMNVPRFEPLEKRPRRERRRLPDPLSLCIHDIPDEGVLDKKAAPC